MRLASIAGTNFAFIASMAGDINTDFMAARCDPELFIRFLERKGFMLVLSRKVGESIKIGDGITIVVNRIAGNRVTLGLKAPRELRIVRGELRAFDEDPKTEEANNPPRESADSTAVGIVLDCDPMTIVPRRAR